MEQVAGNIPCESFETNMFAQSLCQNCFHPEEVHGARHQEPGSPPSAEAPYCELPCRPPAPQDPLSALTSGSQSVVGPGLRSGPERGPSSGFPEESPAAAPRTRSPELEAVPYLEGLTPSSCGSQDKGPNSGTSSSPDGDTPDDTSSSSSVDWDTVEKQEEAPSTDQLTMMIPRRPQEGPRADSGRRSPSLLTKPPVGGDTAGQRKEDTSSGRQHWAKLRGESGYFSLDKLRSAPTQASCTVPQSGPQSATPQASFSHRSAQRDVVQAAPTQRDNPRASSPLRITQRDNPIASSTQQETLRASSPPRTTQRDNPRTSSTQENNPQVFSPSRTIQIDNPRRTSSTQQDNPRTSPTRTPQRDNPRTSCAQRDNLRATSPSRTTQRENPRTSCAQRNNPRTSSPNRTTQRENSRTSCVQRDNPRTSSPNQTIQRDNPRTSCAQRENLRATSPNRTTQWENPRTTCAQRNNPRTSSPNRTTQRENPRTSCVQRDNPRTSSPNQTTQQDNPRTSCAQRDNLRATSPSRTTQRENTRISGAQRDNPRTSCAQQDNTRTSSPNRTTRRDNPRTAYAQKDNPRTSSPNRTTQRDNPRTARAQQDNTRTSSPNRTTQKDNPRTSCAQQDNPRTSSPNRATQQDNPRTSFTQQNTLRTSFTQRDDPKTSCTQRDNPISSCFQRGNPHCPSASQNNPHSSSSKRDNPGTSSSQRCTPKDNRRPSSPHCSTRRNNPRSSSPHRTNKDIPWASFPLRRTQSDGPRTSSPSRSKQSEVPWASVALRPTQGDRPQTSSPTRPAKRDPPQSSSGPTRHNLPSQATSSSHSPGHHSASWTSSPLYPLSRGASQTSSDPSQPPCAVCIGHRDAPRASSPPRYLQHDPFPFFPDPRASESDSVHHDPPYMPPAVCIGHRDAPRASSPPRHAQLDPFPFLPDTSDVESQSPQHDPPQFPPLVCIGYRDAPRASSPPRQAPEPSLLFQDLPRASTESLVPSTDSLHEPPHIPTPVCIGHRDAPYFSSPPRQAPEPSLFYQDPHGTSMESLAPSTDSLHGAPMLLPQVCIGHRDAPRASSPPRHPPSDLVLLALSPPPGSSGGSRGSVPPGEMRHNLEREEYTVLADLPPPRRLAQREPGPQAQGSSGGRTRSPGRAEVERLFGQERRKSEAPVAFQARDEGRSKRPGQDQSHLLRGQSSPALSREVTKPPLKQAEPARCSPAEAPHTRSPERHPEGDRQLQASSQPPRTSARTSERDRRTDRPAESGRGGPRQPLGGQPNQEEPPKSWDPHGHLERDRSSQEEAPGWQRLRESSQGATRAPEGIRRGPPRGSEESWGQRSEAWEEPPSNGLQEPPERSAQRGWGSLQELSSPCPPISSPEDSRVGPTESQFWQPETSSATGWGVEGAFPHPRSPESRPELSWRDLASLFQGPGEGAWAHTGELPLAAHLPRLACEGLLELLQAQLPQRDPARHWGGPAKSSGTELGPLGTKGAPEPEQHSQPEARAEATLVNGHSPGQWSQSLAQLPSPTCTSTQWPKTKVRSGPESWTTAGLEEPGRLGSSAEGPSSPKQEFQSEEPEESERSRGQDSLTDQKQADSPDLLNFKKGWMSILDEPGEWKKHWFVLTDSSLKYYRDSTAEEADELDGEIDLRSCTDVTEYAVQRNYGFQIHTKDAVYTLSAMTSGIRRNWIEALRKTVRPTSAPDVTKLSDYNKENALHSYGTQKGSLKAGEQRAGSEVIGRGGPRKAEGQRQSPDYVELSPLTQSSPQRARPLARAPDRPAKREELERDLAQRSEERRKWFEATDSRAIETPSGEGPRRTLGAPLTEDQQNRLSEEIEKKWQELEKLPLRENKRVPLTALLNQSRSERRGPSNDSHEALEKEVQCLRAQLEAWRLRGEAPQDAPRSQEDGHIPPGYISQEACERSLAEMESSHQQVMEELQRHHERELQRLQQEKEWLLAEETAATASAIEAMKKAYQEELSRELNKTRSLQQGPDGLRKQHQSDVEALKRELQVLSEQYSQKCLEIGALTRQAEEREHTLRRCQQEGQELLRHNQELHTHLSEEIDRLRSFIASQGTGNGCGRSSERSSCELEVLLRVKENELQYLKKEVQCLRDELQMMQKDKRFTSGKYQDVYVELNHIKTRSEREIEQLKEHLRLAMAALQEKESMRNSLAE
ncbi:TRIO and F-actin-binding protein isoform X2 [Elephas maximus indicus]|uniref:TRIO and F-actin-binding protein isoform X2 n=1 Tax=Elephas maximus indicus TaxID=99487 RepID=UPI002116055C|nr:TRIO and F-actin-binding protein isoform X2 [Elephas maximus indicus]